MGSSVYVNATTSAVVITSSAAASSALVSVKAAISQLAADRATIGAYQSRLNYTAEQLTISKENLTAASSRIQDVDVAEESTQYARYNILVQSGTAMLAQANQLPQHFLARRNEFEAALRNAIDCDPTHRPAIQMLADHLRESRAFLPASRL